MHIQDAVIIVTGASSGIGLATVKALSKQGARVALLARSTKVITQLAQNLPDSLPVTADMTKPKDIEYAIQEVHDYYGRIDALINNAGRSYGASIEEIEPDIFDEIMHLNVLGPILAMQAVIPFMRKQGGGSIVNINSGTSFMVIPDYSVYSASKRALVGFSLTARAELEKDSIVVSEIYPGITDTNFGKNRISSSPTGGPASDYSTGDSPDLIAELIIKALEGGEAQYFANDYIKQLAGATR